MNKIKTFDLDTQLIYNLAIDKMDRLQRKVLIYSLLSDTLERRKPKKNDSFNCLVVQQQQDDTKYSHIYSNQNNDIFKQCFKYGARESSSKALLAWKLSQYLSRYIFFFL